MFGAEILSQPSEILKFAGPEVQLLAPLVA